jgi:hypothetical protein
MKTITYDQQHAYIDGKTIDNNRFMFVSRGEWFNKGEIVWLEANCGPAGGCFVGNHTITSEIEAKNRKMNVGDVVELDGELCTWDEFDIYDKDRNLLVKGDTDKGTSL